MQSGAPLRHLPGRSARSSRPRSPTGETDARSPARENTVINHYLVDEGGLDIAAGAVIGLSVESHCQYLEPIAFPEVIDAGLRVAHLGHSSVRYEIAIFRQDAESAAAQGWFVHVFVNRETRKPLEIPERIRAALSRLLRV